MQRPDSNCVDFEYVFIFVSLIQYIYIYTHTFWAMLLLGFMTSNCIEK